VKIQRNRCDPAATHSRLLHNGLALLGRVGVCDVTLQPQSSEKQSEVVCIVEEGVKGGRIWCRSMWNGIITCFPDTGC
jgi:hypothetical protein